MPRPTKERGSERKSTKLIDAKKGKSGAVFKKELNQTKKHMGERAGGLQREGSSFKRGDPPPGAGKGLDEGKSPRGKDKGPRKK